MGRIAASAGVRATGTPIAERGYNLFAFLRGHVADKTPGEVVIDVNGVGYQVFVSDRVWERLSVESSALLLTYCHIREDSFQIFGFLRHEEKALFQLLLGISGVGPKVALAVLSTLGVREFRRAVLENDVTAITSVSGVGKKGAQRIVLETKSKLGQDTELSALLGDEAGGESDTGDDVVAALCALGCTIAEAQRAAKKARDAAEPETPDEELVKSALRSMAKV
jgi:Holliday junction DNA helicase RuvA